MSSKETFEDPPFRVGLMDSEIRRVEVVLEGLERLRASLSGGAGEIALERWRQIHLEKFDQAHDDAHRDGELAKAAMVYAAPASVNMDVLHLWPWNPEENKREKHSRIRQLVIAGALIAAEIDRLRRLETKAPSDECPHGQDWDECPVCRH
jgi:hypothetical protein